MTEVAEPPPEMSREDARRVLAALEENYIDEKQGYGGSHTDESLALSLDVPRKWVSQLRDQFFGPDFSDIETLNGEHSALLELLSEVHYQNCNLHERVQKVEAEYEPLLRECRQAIRNNQGQFNRLKARFEALEKKISALRTQK